MNDASFFDAEPGPLALRAGDADDLAVVSTLTQDAVLQVGEITWDRKARRLALLINRFRWEDAEAARREDRDYERVRALLVISDALRVQSDGIDRSDPETVLSLLALRWQAGADGAGRLELDFAGDGTLAVEAECLNIDLRDVSRPYVAPSHQIPRHPE